MCLLSNDKWWRCLFSLSFLTDENLFSVLFSFFLSFYIRVRFIQFVLIARFIKISHGRTIPRFFQQLVARIIDKYEGRESCSSCLFLLFELIKLFNIVRINIVTSINFNVLNSWTIRVQFWRKLQITISTIVSFLSSNRHIFINTAPFLTNCYRRCYFTSYQKHWQTSLQHSKWRRSWYLFVLMKQKRGGSMQKFATRAWIG